jgi:hypothetical protein
VTVLEDNKPTNHVYRFGKEADKGTVYGKQDEHGLVFTVPVVVLTGLKVDLANPNLCKFDPARAWQVKLSRGKKVLELERKEGTKWNAVTKPDGFVLDQKAVDEFLAKVAGFKVAGFVAPRAAAKPEYGLADPERSLVVDIHVEAQKEPIKLNVGAVDASKKSHYVLSSSQPGEVLLLAADQLDPAVAALKFPEK